jgi:transcriptional regulator with XRE-family HTH domain
MSRYELREVDFMPRLRSQLRALGTQKDLAAHLGISTQYLNDLLRERRDPSDKILAHFGLRRAIVEDES